MTKVKEAFLYDFFSQAELEFLMALPKDEEIQHDFSNAFEEKMKNVMMRREKKSFFSRFVHSRGGNFVLGGIVLFLLIFRKEIVGAAQSIFQRYMEDPIFVTKKHEPLRVPYVQYAEDQIFKALEPTYLPEGYKEIDRKTKDTSQSILYKDRAGRTLSYEQYIYDTRISLFYFKSTEVFIQDTKVEIVKGVQIKEKTIGVYWRGQKNIFLLRAKDMEEEEILKIAESLIKQEE